MTIAQNHVVLASVNGQIETAAHAVVRRPDVKNQLAKRMQWTALGAVALAGLTLALRPSLVTAPADDASAFSSSLPAANYARSAPASAAQAAGSVATLTGLPAKDERNLIGYLARKWRVADAAVTQIVQTAVRAGNENRVDPLLILAVMSVESGMNPYAESQAGAQGLMQVMTSVHKDKFERFGGEQSALHPVANIFVGAQILADVVRRGGSMEQGLKLYVGAGNLDSDGGYGARVLGERTRIANATQGRFDYTTPGFGIPPLAAAPARAAPLKTSAESGSKQDEPAAALDTLPAKDTAKDSDKEREAKPEKVASTI